MNQVNLIGRLTKDIDMKETADGRKVARFSVAVNRSYKNKEGKYEADYINCVAFGQGAEFLEKYYHKGDPIVIKNAEIRTGKYQDKNGQTVFTTDVHISQFGGTEFCPRSKNGAEAAASSSGGEEWMDVPDTGTEGLPF